MGKPAALQPKDSDYDILSEAEWNGSRRSTESTPSFSHPRKEAVWFWNERFHSRIAETNKEAPPVVVCCESVV